MINLTRGVHSRFHHIRLNKNCSRTLICGKPSLPEGRGTPFSSTILSSRPWTCICIPTLLVLSVLGDIYGKWFQGKWPPNMHLNKDRAISIEWQELFPIVVAYAIWFPHFSGKRIQFWCDNESVVAILNSDRSRAPCIMDLLRFLVLISMKHNFFIRARHVPRLSNEIANALSRFQVSCFWAAAPTASKRRSYDVGKLELGMDY